MLARVVYLEGTRQVIYGGWSSMGAGFFDGLLLGQGLEGKLFLFGEIRVYFPVRKA